MSDFSTFLDEIRDWLARPDHTDATVTSFVRMAEATLSQALRVKEMVVNSTANGAVTGEVVLPTDWQELSVIRVDDSKPYEYIPVDDFYSLADNSYKYTLMGDSILLGGEYDTPPVVDIWYYQRIPAFSDTSTWLHSRYYTIFLQACNAAGSLYAEEFERAASIDSMVSKMVQDANMKSSMGQFSGSVLKRKIPRRIG